MKKHFLSLALAAVMCAAPALTTFAAHGSSPSEQALFVEWTSLIDGQFPKNIHGETYGNGLMAIEAGQTPDLQAAVGTDGREGYVRTSDLRHPTFKTPQEALEWQLSQPDSYDIPLYDFQGQEIGAFRIERSNLSLAEMETLRK